MRCPANASALTWAMCSRASWLRLVVRRTRRPSRTSGIDHQRGARQANERQARVHVDEHGGVADDRQRLARQIADRLRHRELHLGDVVGQARHQPAGGLPREVGGRLVEDVAKERAPQIVDDPLADLRHPQRRQVGAHALQDVEAEHRPGDQTERPACRQHLVEDRLDQRRDARLRQSVHHHRHECADEPPAIGPGVLEESEERLHSVNRYLSKTQTATTPSRQPIFLPSS